MQIIFSSSNKYRGKWLLCLNSACLHSEIYLSVLTEYCLIPPSLWFTFGLRQGREQAWSFPHVSIVAGRFTFTPESKFKCICQRDKEQWQWRTVCICLEAVLDSQPELCLGFQQQAQSNRMISSTALAWNLLPHRIFLYGTETSANSTWDPCIYWSARCLTNRCLA